jgi:UDP-N-acetylglucosamine transferase subunit ALG13
MSARQLRAGLDEMLTQEGVTGCALVDMDAGMVLQWVGPEEHLPVAEAASDYWRLCARQQGIFGVLGAPRAQVVIHEHTRVTIVRCGEGLLLVTLSLESRNVDWPRWRRAANHVQQLAAAL